MADNMFGDLMNMFGGDIWGGKMGDIFTGGGGEEHGLYTEQQNHYAPMPDYAETDWARGAMKDKLEGWGNEAGYGAIAPNWDEIWDMSKKKVKQFYWGDEMGGGGMVGKLKADAARKGQSDQPAYAAALSRMGKAEAGQLSDIATQQSMAESQFAEQGRLNWMNEMNTMMGLKPDYRNVGTSQQQYQVAANPTGGGSSGGGGSTGNFDFGQTVDQLGNIWDQLGIGGGGGGGGTAQIAGQPQTGSSEWWGGGNSQTGWDWGGQAPDLTF